MEHNQTEPGQGRERRTKFRFAVDDDASLSLVHQGATIPCHILDLSVGGCRVRTQARFLAGPMIRVEVSFKILGFALRLSGVTQWTDRHQTAGIRFTDLTPRRVEALTELLAEVEARSAARIENENPAGAESSSSPAVLLPSPVASARLAPPPAPAAPASKKREPAPALVQSPPVAAPQAEDKARPTGQSQAPSPVLASSPDPAPLQRRERRTQSRYSVDTSAVIHLVTLASALPGQIVDLSQGGCRIRTAERFPVGIFRRVETEFNLHGLPFRLGGVTQSLHDRRTVGIRFLDMSDRKRQQLIQLIEEIDAERALIPPDIEAAKSPIVESENPAATGGKSAI